MSCYDQLLAGGSHQAESNAKQKTMGWIDSDELGGINMQLGSFMEVSTSPTLTQSHLPIYPNWCGWERRGISWGLSDWLSGPVSGCQVVRLSGYEVRV